MAVTVRLNSADEARLDRLCEATGRSKAFYLRQLVEEHLDDLEDLHVSERRLEDLRAGRTFTVSWAEIVPEEGDSI